MSIAKLVKGKEDTWNDTSVPELVLQVDVNSHERVSMYFGIISVLLRREQQHWLQCKQKQLPVLAQTKYRSQLP